MPGIDYTASTAEEGCLDQLGVKSINRIISKTQKKSKSIRIGSQKYFQQRKELRQMRISKL